MKHMKKYKLIYRIAIFCPALFFMSCQKEEKGLLTTDDTIPNALTEVEVENLPGGARIKYKAPEAEDILLVEASYKRNGKIVTAKSSVYKKFVTIEGLRDTVPQEVNLRVVDKSNNMSAAVRVTINPKKAPIDKFFESFRMVADDFDGEIKLKYNNEDNIKAELRFYIVDGYLPIYNQSAFIENDDKTVYTLGSFDPKIQIFGVSVIDRWNNITSIKKTDVSAEGKMLLDIKKFKGLSLVGDAPNGPGTWVLSNLWDGKNDGGTEGFHTSHGNLGAIVPPYTEAYHMFTMDLGVTAKLSKMKIWLRKNCCNTPYGHGDPKYFEVWGIDKIPADNGASLEGWTRLIKNGEVIKPSGLPLGSHSEEDKEQAKRGEEFDITIENNVRYIRFVNIENWNGGKFMHIIEIKFWGE